MIGIELQRQARRRRTLFAFAAIVLVPAVVLVALLINGPAGPEATSSSEPSLIDVANASGINFAFFTLMMMSNFLLIVIAALFAGDTIASEAQWGSLRYLLTRPVSRGRLAYSKIVVAAIYSVIATVAIPVVALIMGGFAFGWGGLEVSPLGTVSVGASLGKLTVVTLFVTATMLVVVALGFWFSTLTDQPLTAVGAVVLLTIISQILDMVTALGPLRNILPTHYWGAWWTLLAEPVDASKIVVALLQFVPWIAGPLLLGLWHFRHKDVLS